jgi:hypothetical protein
MDALTEIHRALGAGEIASDEASRLVDLVGRTARVLAAKAAAVIDFADRLERCEQALITLFNAARAAAAPETATSQVPQATAAPAIDNNNAKTMAPAAEAEAQAPTEAAAEAEARAPTAASEPAPIDNNNGITMEAAAALDEAVRTTLPPRADSVRDRLLADAA